MSEALSFAEIKLALLQGFLGVLAVSNDLHGAEKFVGPSRCVSLRIAWHRARALGSYDVDCGPFAIGTQEPKITAGPQSIKQVLLYSPEETPAISSVAHRPTPRQVL